MLANEGLTDFCGTVHRNRPGTCYLYNAWDNCLEPADYTGGALKIHIEPLKLRIVVFDSSASLHDLGTYTKNEVLSDGERLPFCGEWQRSLCHSANYPAFGTPRTVTLPDRLAEEQPEFSGYVRYENTFSAQSGDRLVLEITDAYEGIEVFVNDRSLGFQIVPPYRYALNDALISGENRLRIEVATTLEREQTDKRWVLDTNPTGITGEVTLWKS